MKKLVLILTAAVATLFATVSCQKEEKINVTDSEGITISPATLTVQHHYTAELKATITPSNATSKSVKWETSNKDVATVTNFGIVEGVKPGTAKITATTADGKFNATCEVTVVAVAVTGITIDKTTLELIEGDAKTLTATVAPEKATEKSVIWTTSNKKVATVESGKVTAIGMGTATITATTKDGGKTATCAVTVKPITPDKVEQVVVWKDDEPGYRAILGDNTDKTEGFLKYSAASKVVTWDANTTGKPRTGVIEFSNGSKLTVTQVEEKDFKGKWDFRTQRFSNNTNVTTAAADVTIELTFGDALTGETLKDFDGKEYTNNIGVKGLYLDAIADATVIIDYPGKSAKFGLFLDERKAQPVKNGNANYPYVCFIPECGTTWNAGAMSAPWNFVPKPISATQNYQWLWFDVKEDLKTLQYDHPYKQNLIGKDGSNGTTIIGITCAVAKNATPTADDIYGTYNVIYQANPGKKNDVGGFMLTRK